MDCKFAIDALEVVAEGSGIIFLDDVYFTKVVALFDCLVLPVAIFEHHVGCLPHFEEVDAHYAVSFLEDEFILDDEHRSE